MADASEIREHMEVIVADGGHVGTVDHVEGGRLKLTKSDRGSGGKHHYLGLNFVEDVDGGKVRLLMKAELVPQFWEEGSAGPRAARVSCEDVEGATVPDGSDFAPPRRVLMPPVPVDA